MANATESQRNYIALLARKAGLGRYYSDGVKAVLGKVPVNFTKERASEVIDELKKRVK